MTSVADDVRGAVGDKSSAAPRRLLREQEFDVFYKKHARPLMTYITRLCGEAGLAEDLFQKSLYLFLRTPLPVEDAAALPPYLYRIATNVVHDHWRQQKREKQGLLAWLGFWSEKEPATRPDLSHDLRTSLLALNPKERALLWFAHVEGLDHRQIAVNVGVREASVRVLLHRARTNLATVLARRGLTGGAA